MYGKLALSIFAFASKWESSSTTSNRDQPSASSSFASKPSALPASTFCTTGGCRPSNVSAHRIACDLPQLGGPTRHVYKFVRIFLEGEAKNIPAPVTSAGHPKLTGKMSRIYLSKISPSRPTRTESVISGTSRTAAITVSGSLSSTGDADAEVRGGRL